MPGEPKYNWGIEAALDIIGGKWKPLILYELKDGTLRFSQLQGRVKPHITQRMLTKQLRQLEDDGLVTRRVYPQVPPKVEYSLTENGRSIIPILDLLCEWGEEHLSERIKYWCDEQEVVHQSHPSPVPSSNPRIHSVPLRQVPKKSL